MSLSQYYKGFKSVLGYIAGALASLPLLAAILPQPISTYLYPPLGDIQPVACVGTVGFLGLATFVVYFLHSRKPSVCIAGAGVLAFASFAVYLALCSCFVRKIDIPSQKTAVFVSVGYERTEFADRTFGGMNDWQMLRERGLSDEDIRMLWTSKSLTVARLGLWVFVTASLAFTVAALGFGIICQNSSSSKVA